MTIYQICNRIWAVVCLFLVIASPLRAENGDENKNEFTVLQWNIWQEGTMVKGGYEAIADEIS